MKIYSGNTQCSKTEPALQNVGEANWVISQLLRKDYARQLASFFHRRVGFSVVPSDYYYNSKPHQVFKASINPKPEIFVLDKEDGFAPCRIFAVNRPCTILGSVDPTYGGFTSCVEFVGGHLEK